MADRQVVARARVKMTIDLEADGTWGNDCSLAQILKQAEHETVEKVYRLVSGAHPRHKLAIVGKPVVTAVIAREKG